MRTFWKQMGWLAGAVTVMVTQHGGASESTRYRAILDFTWSSATHQAPANPHFSSPIGVTHNRQVQFWAPGELASPGIQRMAERGSHLTLVEEINPAIAAGNADATVLFCCALNSPASDQVTFPVNSDFSLVTLVSMIAPSPDWFVGVHDLDLHPDDHWLSKVVIDLLPYDAGTDDGLTFTANDKPAEPHVPISRLTTNPFPTDLPLGTLSFVRVVAGDVSENGELDVDDINALTAAVRTSSGDLKYDVDGDRLVNATDRAQWVHNVRHTYFGDANLDGRFNSMDLISVLTEGQYEDELSLNARWETGDWDGDGEFGSADLILALSDGGYELATSATAAVNAHAVPEPANQLPLLLGAILGAAQWSRRHSYGSRTTCHCLGRRQ